ncbi:hypothetical protein SFR_3983 [Streptomyces sp. FR-008]|nr:hypothetical protein SFR_3983 [Streptomyces sp. FR-008]
MTTRPAGTGHRFLCRPSLLGQPSRRVLPMI